MTDHTDDADDFPEPDIEMLKLEMFRAYRIQQEVQELHNELIDVRRDPTNSYQVEKVIKMASVLNARLLDQSSWADEYYHERLVSALIGRVEVSAEPKPKTDLKLVKKPKGKKGKHK